MCVVFDDLVGGEGGVGGLIGDALLSVTALWPPAECWVTAAPVGGCRC